MEESKRLFFGNPMETVGMKPLPVGKRLCFGESSPEPATPPMLHPDAKVLAYGNSPIRPQRDRPFEVVGNIPVFAHKPTTR